MRSATGDTAGRPSALANWPAVMQAPALQRRLLRMADDQRAEPGGVGQAALEHPGARHARASVKATAPASIRKPISVISAPLAALGQRRHRQHVDRARPDGAARG